MRSESSSFRISRELHDRLKRVADRQGRGKNAVLIEAITAYLQSVEREELVCEARRQSKLVAQTESQEDWVHFIDPSLWQ